MACRPGRAHVAVRARPACRARVPEPVPQPAPRPAGSPSWDILAGVLLLGGAGAWLIGLLVLLGVIA
jgi:hypothetical protein